MAGHGCHGGSREGVAPRPETLPDAIGHLNVLVAIHLAGQLELAVKALGGEETLQEGVEQALVKLVVHAATIDGLSHQGLQG